MGKYIIQTEIYNKYSGVKFDGIFDNLRWSIFCQRVPPQQSYTLPMFRGVRCMYVLFVVVRGLPSILHVYYTCNIIGCVCHTGDSSEEKNNDTKSLKQHNISLILISYQFFFIIYLFIKIQLYMQIIQTLYIQFPFLCRVSAGTRHMNGSTVDMSYLYLTNCPFTGKPRI